MTITEKIETVDNKLEPNKAQYIYIDKLLRFQLYHQKMLVNMNFLLAKIFCQKKNLLEKAATMKSFDYSPLGKELKAQRKMTLQNNSIKQ